MTKHTITIQGQCYSFELHSYPHGAKVMVDAPGVGTFDVEEPDALNKARDILRSVYYRHNTED